MCPNPLCTCSVRSRIISPWHKLLNKEEILEFLFNVQNLSSDDFTATLTSASWLKMPPSFLSRHSDGHTRFYHGCNVRHIEWPVSEDALCFLHLILQTITFVFIHDNKDKFKYQHSCVKSVFHVKAIISLNVSLKPETSVTQVNCGGPYIQTKHLQPPAHRTSP